MDPLPVAQEPELEEPPFFIWPEPSGTRYEIDDHCFISPPYSQRSGEPYLVARILDFTKPKVGDAAHTEPRVKLAFYLRPRDISSRYIADHRVLLATMHADDAPMSFIRGKCRVHHRERLPCDLETYKREPDSFYYHQLYDRYLHRYFDLLPTERVQNAPPDALAYLNAHFEFVCCEVGMAHELSDALRGCSECHKWASNAESVTCAVCRKMWHLQCVEPPLAKRPPAGYGWTCAPCAVRREADVERYMAGEDGMVKPSMLTKEQVSMAKKPSLKGKEPATPPSRDGKLKQTNGWPFRYFGQHSDPTTITDPHDSFYPRASTRVGHKFQISAVYLDGEADPADRRRRKGQTVGVKRDRSGHPKPVEPHVRKRETRAKMRQEIRSLATHLRGGEETVDVISQGLDDPEKEPEVDALFAAAHEQSLYKKAGVTFLDEAVAVYFRPPDPAHPDDTPLMRQKRIKLRELGMSEWSELEVEKFNEGILEHQDDLEEVASTLPRKTVGDVVNYYYVTRIDMERQLDQQHNDDKWADGVAPAALTGEGTATSLADNDTESVADERPADEPEPLGPCAICEITDSATWFKCPPGIGTSLYTATDKVVCRECSIQWRHYGSDVPAAVEDAAQKKAAAKVGRPKAFKGESSPVQELVPAPVVPERPPPPPKPIAIPKPCVICKKMEPKEKLATCARCCLSGHFDCCGIDGSQVDEKWLCMMCKAWNSLRRPHPNSHCAICPPRKLKGPSDPLSALDLYTPTTDNGFVHLLCAILHPEISFQDLMHMEPVEGATIIAPMKWSKECFVCNQSDAGACIKCADCSKQFHVSCAWQAGYKFAFEIQPVKKKKQLQGVSVQFQEENGAMEPKIWCRSHKIFKSNRIVYDFATKDTNSDLNALQIFVRNFKQPRPVDSYPLLRQALRLDSVIAPILVPERTLDALNAVSAIAALDMPLTAGGRPRTAKFKLPGAAAPVIKPRATAKPKAKPRGKARTPKSPVLDTSMNLSDDAPISEDVTLSEDVSVAEESATQVTPSAASDSSSSKPVSLKIKLHLPAAPPLPPPPTWEYEEDVAKTVPTPDESPIAARTQVQPDMHELIDPQLRPEATIAAVPTEVPATEALVEPNPKMLEEVVPETLPDPPEARREADMSIVSEIAVEADISVAPEAIVADISVVPEAPVEADIPAEPVESNDEAGEMPSSSESSTSEEEDISEFEEPNADNSDDEDYVLHKRGPKRKVFVPPPVRAATASSATRNSQPPPAQSRPTAPPQQHQQHHTHGTMPSMPSLPPMALYPPQPVNGNAFYQSEASTSHQLPQSGLAYPAASTGGSPSWGRPVHQMPPQPQYSNYAPPAHTNGAYDSPISSPYGMPEASYFPPGPAPDAGYNYAANYAVPAGYEYNQQRSPAPNRAMAKSAALRRRRSPIPTDASCYNCQTAETPVWRRDDEHHILCNSCGQYWKAHGKHRPMTLKGPKRTINKYAPQGNPPAGALIKNSQQDKVQQQQKFAAIAAAAGEVYVPPIPGVRGKYKKRQGTDSQPTTPTYGEPPPLSPQYGYTPPDPQRYVPPYPSHPSHPSHPQYHPGFGIAVSQPSYNYPQQWSEVHPPTSHPGSAIAGPPPETAAQHPLMHSAPVYSPAPQPRNMYEQGGGDVLDPALLAMGGARGPPPPPQVPAQHDIPIAWGHQFAAVQLPQDGRFG